MPNFYEITDAYGERTYTSTKKEAFAIASNFIKTYNYATIKKLNENHDFNKGY